MKNIVSVILLILTVLGFRQAVAADQSPLIWKANFESNESFQKEWEKEPKQIDADWPIIMGGLALLDHKKSARSIQRFKCGVELNFNAEFKNNGYDEAVIGFYTEPWNMVLEIRGDVPKVNDLVFRVVVAGKEPVHISLGTGRVGGAHAWKLRWLDDAIEVFMDGNLVKRYDESLGESFIGIPKGALYVLMMTYGNGTLIVNSLDVREIN